MLSHRADTATATVPTAHFRHRMHATATAATVEAPTDDELVARVVDGDVDAFATLVERYKRPVYTLAYRMLGNAADAEDAAQETFVRAYTRLGTYQPGGKFGAWLAAICSHWCLDLLRLRRRRVQTVALGKVPESDRFIEVGNEPEERALARDAANDVGRWLDALSPSYRAVLVLRYLHDLSYNEIADALGEPVAAVRMRLFRARRQLQGVVDRERAAGRGEPPRPVALQPRPA